MPGIRIDGDYLIIENSDRPQKWTANELGVALKWASTDGKKLMKLEHDVYDSLDKAEARLMSLLMSCLENMNALFDYLGLEIQDLPAARKVVKKEE